MSAGTMENIGSALKVKPKSSGFLKYRAALIFSSQAVLIVLTYYASFLLRLDADLDAPDRAMFWKTLPFVLLIKLVLSYQCGLMHGWWRYVGISDLLDISKTSLLSSSLIFCLVEARPPASGISPLGRHHRLVPDHHGAGWRPLRGTRLHRTRPQLRRAAQHADCRRGRSRQRHRARIEAELQPELQPGGSCGRRSQQERASRFTGSRFWAAPTRCMS